MDRNQVVDVFSNMPDVIQILSRTNMDGGETFTVLVAAESKSIRHNSINYRVYSPECYEGLVSDLGMTLIYDASNSPKAVLAQLHGLAKLYIGTLVFDVSWNISRLVGLTEGEKHYWEYLSGPRGTYSISTDAPFIPLKGKLDDADYAQLEQSWKLRNQGL